MKNIIANFIGIIWYAFANLIATPIYLKLLGVEAFGLIGIFNSIYAASILLDLGISPAINREMAQLSASSGNEGRIRTLFKTVESVYWLATLAIGLLIILISPVLAKYWLNIESLSIVETRNSFILMGISLIFQLPVSFYTNVYLGLQKHVALNLINICAITFRFSSSILALIFLKSGVEVFFLLQAISSALHISILRLYIQNVLPQTAENITFSKKAFLDLGKFAIGIGGFTISEFFLSQIDKIILSVILPLKVFGYFSLATTLASVPTLFVRAIGNSTYPKFSSLISLNNEQGLRKCYHQSSQIMAVCLFPISVTLALFAKEVLLLWTKNAEIAQNAAPILAFMILGNCFYGIMKNPLMLTLSYGWTRFGLIQNIISICFFLPWLFISTKYIGALSSPTGWLAINIFILLIGVNYIHLRYLKTEKYRFYIKDTFLPFLGALIIPLLARNFLTVNVEDNALIFVLYLIIIFSGSFLLSLLSIKELSSYAIYGLKLVYNKFLSPSTKG
jgi:O-antigen/teichoic acid export membrane protein